jgi:hypothetical protein
MDENAIVELIKGNKLALEAVAEQLDGFTKMATAFVKEFEAKDEKEKKDKEEKDEKEKFEKLCKAVVEAIKKDVVSVAAAPKEEMVQPKGPDATMEAGKVPEAQQHQQVIDDGKAGAAESLPGAQKEMEEGVVVKKMQEEMENLRKQMDEMKATEEERIKKELSTRLAKAGWREEKKLAQPEIKRYIEGSGDIMISKDAKPEEAVEKLSKLSYKTLRDMQSKTEKETGDGFLAGTWNV